MGAPPKLIGYANFVPQLDPRIQRGALLKVPELDLNAYLFGCFHVGGGAIDAVLKHTHGVQPDNVVPWRAFGVGPDHLSSG